MAKEKIKVVPAPTRSAVSQQNDKTTLAFGKENYRMMLIGIVISAVGMLLMIGGASEDPNVFSEEIFNFQRLTLAPIVIIAGYVVVLLAILKKPKE